MKSRAMTTLPQVEALLTLRLPAWYMHVWREGDGKESAPMKCCGQFEMVTQAEYLDPQCSEGRVGVSQACWPVCRGGA